MPREKLSSPARKGTDPAPSNAPLSPQRRIEASDPVVERPVPELASNFIGLLIASLSMRLSRSASSFYNQNWGIGTTEYRLLLALRINQECSAVSVAAAADVDKAAASRSLQILSREGYVNLIRQGREMTISLTESGRELSQKLHWATLEREKRLTTGLTEPEVARLHADLCRLIENLPELSNVLPAMGGASAEIRQPDPEQHA